MNEREISEIKKRFRVDKSNITRLRGCYINEKKEIISRFNQPISMMSAEETEEILTVLKKTLTGSVGKNLLNINFTNEQVLSSDEHKLLSSLRSTALSDDEAVEKLIEIIRENLVFDGNYMILLASDSYDVPSYSSDGKKNLESASVYSYFLCSICPVKMTKSALGYYLPENRFKNVSSDWVIAPPETGFLFPAFDGRTANIYSTLFFTKNTADNHGELIEGLFKTVPPMPAEEQKLSFGTLLRDSVSEECSYDVVCTVQEKLNEIIEEHKATKDPDPLVVSKNTVGAILKDCGVRNESVEVFEEKFESTFGSHAEISPTNLLNTKQLEVTTPEISIKLPPEAAGFVETKIIDGKKYIMILAEDPVEVNGIEINIL